MAKTEDADRVTNALALWDWLEQHANTALVTITNGQVMMLPMGFNNCYGEIRRVEDDQFLWRSSKPPEGGWPDPDWEPEEEDDNGTT